MNENNASTSPLLVALLSILCVTGSCAVYPGFFTSNDYISVIVGAIILFFALFVLIKIYRRKKIHYIIIGSIFVPIIIILGVKIRIDDYHIRLKNEENREIRRVTQEAKERWGVLVNSASIVCRGTGNSVQGASPYGTNIGKVHPILIIDELTGDDLGADYYDSKPDWKPDSVEYLQLVACVKMEWKTVETCRYYGGTAYREQQIALVSVYEANSGRLVNTFSVSGAMPRECLATEVFFNNATTKSIRGDNLQSPFLVSTLSPIVVP